jgi:CHAT domain-containing protein
MRSLATVLRKSTCASPRLCFAFISALVLLAGINESCARQPKPQPQTPDEAFAHLWKAYLSGDLLLAEAEAEKDYAQFHSVSPAWAWKYKLLTARILYQRGLYNEALKVMASEPTPLPGGDLTVKNLWLHGLIDTSLRHFDAVEHELAEAERMCNEKSYPSCGGIPGALGAMEMQRGRFEKAQSSFERSLSMARANGNFSWQANALLDLSHSAEQQSHFDESLAWADSARQIAVPQKLGSVVQAALGNMGWAYYKLGDNERAQQLFIEAEKQAEQLGDVSDQIKWTNNVGDTRIDAGDPSAAEQAFRQSLDLAREINSREDIIDSLTAVASVSELTGKVDDAKRYADEALRMATEDGNKVDQAYVRLVQGRIAAREHDAVTAQNALEEVVDSKDSPVFLKWEAQRALARLYEDEHQNEGANREYRAALSTFEAARSELKHENTRLPFLTNATHIYDDYIHFLISRGKSDEALQVAEYSRARTLNEGLGLLKIRNSEHRVASTAKKPTPRGTRYAVLRTQFQPDPLNASLVARRAGGSIFFYWLGEKQSYLWLVRAQKTTLFTLPPASEIDAMVRRYRNALQGPQDPLETLNSEGITLYRTLVAPAKALLPKKNARVFIIPDGSLNTLNFETLIVPDHVPHYWIEDVTLADAGSLRLLAASHPAASHTLPLLMIGDAVAANVDYPELQKASVEMQSIGKHFAPAQQKIYTREQATPAAYLSSKPEQFSYIHFVAHGTASRTNPLDSAIVLSPATKEDDSFKLYARDIIHHRLRADLVTISTCYGAGFRAYTGEGLVGLSWAFLRAGAHNVIGALWEVSDVSTPQLMDKLYGDLKSGQQPDSALRNAKLTLLHSNKAFSKPFYWAPFQLYTGS